MGELFQFIRSVSLVVDVSFVGVVPAPVTLLESLRPFTFEKSIHNRNSIYVDFRNLVREVLLLYSHGDQSKISFLPPE